MEDLIQAVLTRLKEAEEFIVPVRKIYRGMEDRIRSEGMSESEFIDLLKSDRRIRFFEASGNDKKDGISDNVTVEEMEKVGFYSGPRVMLKDRLPTREEVLSILLKKADTTFSTLQKAWDIRPEGDEETEDQLLDALAKAQRLQRELQSLLDHDNDDVSDKH